MNSSVCYLIVVTLTGLVVSDIANQVNTKYKYSSADHIQKRTIKGSLLNQSYEQTGINAVFQGHLGHGHVIQNLVITLNFSNVSLTKEDLSVTNDCNKSKVLEKLSLTTGIILYTIDEKFKVESFCIVRGTMINDVFDLEILLELSNDKVIEILGNNVDAELVITYSDYRSIKFTKDAKREFSTAIISGSPFGTFLDMGMSLEEDFDVIVAISTNTLETRIIKVLRPWTNEAIHLGRIDEPFTLLIKDNSYPPIALDNASLYINNKDIQHACNATDFSCLTGLCIDKKKLCDMEYDCLYGEDEKGCNEDRNTFKHCDFEHGMCEWANENHQENCSWHIADSSRVRFQFDMFEYKSKGHILFINGSKCAGKCDVVLKSPFFKQKHDQNRTCKMLFSYIRYNIYLKVVQCLEYSLGEEDCSTDILYPFKEKTWLKQTVEVPFSTNRMRIEFIATLWNEDKSQFVALDGISFDDACFADNDDILHKHEESALINIVAVIIPSIFIAAFIIFLVLQYKKYRRNGETFPDLMSKFKSWKFKSSTSLYKYSKTSILYGDHSATSPVYALAYEDNHEEYIHTIPRRKIAIKKLLGKGNFGEVYYGLLLERTEKTPVAIKTLPHLCSDQTKSDFFIEGITLSKLKHENIVHLLGISVEGSSIFLVTEYMNGGDLRSHLRLLRGDLDDSTLKYLVNICIDIACGCQYLEENYCIHRDLAARNCLLHQTSNDMRVKVCDFGMSRFTGSANYYRKIGSAPLPVKWMSPEAFLEGIFTSKTDVWSYGVLLWEVFTLGCQPYPGKSHDEVIKYVKNGGTLPKPEFCTDEVYDLMFGCWNLCPEDRPKFESIRNKLITIRENGVRHQFSQNYYAALTEICTV